MIDPRLVENIFKGVFPKAIIQVVERYDTFELEIQVAQPVGVKRMVVTERIPHPAKIAGSEKLFAAVAQSLRRKMERVIGEAVIDEGLGEPKFVHTYSPSSVLFPNPEECVATTHPRKNKDLPESPEAGSW